MASKSYDWMQRVLNSKSKSFCGAKWYNATIWLGNGMTASCHHPTPHRIDETKIKKNPAALHNTTEKKLARKQMQEGVQPKECDYCWKVENLNKEIVSDRFYKSKPYAESELQQAFETPWMSDVNLKQLEIAFDSNCNFACSYCNAGYSTTWAHDIKKNGAYQDLVSDGGNAFTHDGKWAIPYGPQNKDNPYVEAFWSWWESDLQYTLDELRITGGEATVSNSFWKLVDWYEANPECRVALSVNTNLGVKQSHLDRLCRLSEQTEFVLFTSNESMGAHAEYIRDGLVWETWKANLEYAIVHGSFKQINVMTTINALCLASFEHFHEYLLDLREKHNTTIEFSHNILRFPSFQSITVLPKTIRMKKAAKMRKWLHANRSRLADWEQDTFSRTIHYIEEIDEGHEYKHSNLRVRQGDFYNFYRQYDKRRGKDFNEAFKDWPQLLKWYETAKTNMRRPITELTNGDPTDKDAPNNK